MYILHNHNNATKRTSNMLSKPKQDLRKKQIDTLKLFNDNVTEIKNCEHYAVGFICGGRNFKIDVVLAASFPEQKPQLTISPSIEHPWVIGPTGDIENAPGLLNFTVHSDLGRVVLAIIREFEKYPPQLYVETASPHNLETCAYQPTTPACNDTTNMLSSSAYLATLSLEELQKMDEQPEYLNDFVEELEVIQSLNTQLDNLINDVEIIADDNMGSQQQILDLNGTISMSKNTIRQLGAKYDVSSKHYQQKANEFMPSHIKELLQIAVSTADAGCELNVREFLEGKIDVQIFLDRYLKIKILSASRKAKEERLSHQLNALERAQF